MLFDVFIDPKIIGKIKMKRTSINLASFQYIQSSWKRRFIFSIPPIRRGAMCRKKTYIQIVLAAAWLCSSPGAGATLFDRGNGLIYDDALDVTWLQDANLGAGSAFDDGDSDSDGRMTWASALAWAGDLVFGGFDDWRIPSMDVNDDDTVINCHSLQSELVCRDNEPGYMFGQNLDFMPANQNIFRNIQIDGIDYWSTTLLASNMSQVWTQNVGGEFNTVDQRSTQYAWAIRDGDVALPSAPTWP